VAGVDRFLDVWLMNLRAFSRTAAFVSTMLVGGMVEWWRAQHTTEDLFVAEETPVLVAARDMVGKMSVRWGKGRDLHS
jgi:hypothetical protein